MHIHSKISSERNHLSVDFDEPRESECAQSFGLGRRIVRLSG